MIYTSCRLVGYNYYSGRVPEEKGEMVLLTPNPNNKYDKFAVGVFDTDFKQIGHIAKDKGKNEFIFNKLNGESTYAEVCFRDNSKDDFPIILIDIAFMSKDGFKATGPFLA
jgi:hypothetical protein